MTTIAIIDDDQGLRRALVALLEGSNRELVSYESGEAFLDEVADRTIDLAVLDLRLPGLSGIKVLERLRPLSFPVVMMSANGDIRTAVDAIKLGATDFIEKPFTPEDLESLIDRVLGDEELRDGTDLAPMPEDWPQLDALTPREREVALALNEGLTNKEVARRLGCSPRTIEVHRARVFHKLGVSNIAGLVRTVSGFDLPP
ncbi:two-component response regulator [Parvularcula bermudensis HTCC2503]|uniref:Two-component response regulator n=1 Tax=Parvularcula bermudensis (strain ATCC BAA-594 / HTCC2503 / KCTC 12087) TaxID=314260 RepID=E0TFD6_PARBH|nr:response regulator [Parvularcula bermudensis]ADM09537.1 two-component response regulator [Parvularcula bermudensis HTCC2503]